MKKIIFMFLILSNFNLIFSKFCNFVFNAGTDRNPHWLIISNVEVKDCSECIKFLKLHEENYGDVKTICSEEERFNIPNISTVHPGADTPAQASAPSTPGSR